MELWIFGIGFILFAVVGILMICKLNEAKDDFVKASASFVSARDELYAMKARIRQDSTLLINAANNCITVAQTSLKCAEGIEKRIRATDATVASLGEVVLKFSKEVPNA